MYQSICCAPPQTNIPYGGKVWWVESLANLANSRQFTELKPSKVIVTINNPLADLFICQTIFLKRVKSPNILPAKLSRYTVYVELQKSHQQPVLDTDLMLR